MHYTVYEKDHIPYIYLITVFDKCEPKEKPWEYTLGSTRSVGWRPTFEMAEEVVKTNMCDIWEYCYDYNISGAFGNETGGINLWTNTVSVDSANPTTSTKDVCGDVIITMVMNLIKTISSKLQKKKVYL